MTGGCVEWLSNTEISSFERTTQTSSDIGQTKTLEIPSYLENKTKMCTLLIANRIRILLMIDDYYNTSLISRIASRIVQILSLIVNTPGSAHPSLRRPGQKRDLFLWNVP